MSDKQTIRALRSNAEWCLMTYKGVKLASGKPKKPPTYQIVKCRKCGDVSLVTKRHYQMVADDEGVRRRAPVKPMPCALKIPYRYDEKKMSLPRMRVCKGDVDVVEEIGPEE